MMLWSMDSKGRPSLITSDVKTFEQAEHEIKVLDDSVRENNTFVVTDKIHTYEFSNDIWILQ